MIHAERGSRAVLPSLGLLFAIALWLRFTGIAFGLPDVFHPDEGTSIGEALSLIRGNTDALSFANPPLYKYVLVGLFGGMVGIQRLAAIDSSLLYLVGRGASAVLGALTVLVVFWLARMLRGQRAGLMAAGLASCTYLLVRESHFAVNDALATLCATAALAACVRVACRGRRIDYVLAGAGVGLAFAAKYQCAALAVPWFVAHVQHGRRRRDVDLLLGMLVALVTAAVACPPFLTETRRVVADVYVFLMLPSRLGFEGLDPAGGYVYYLKSFGWGIGWPLLALGCLGIVLAGARREWPLLAVASLPVCLYAVMGSSHMYVARFLLPALPALVVLASVALHDVGNVVPVGPPLLTGLALLGTLPSAMHFDVLLTRVDTRTEARAWVQTHVPAGARVLADAGVSGPPLASLPLTLLLPQGHAMYDVGLDEYRAQGVEYVVTSSYLADMPNLDPNRATRRREFYASLERSAKQVAEFRPDTGGEPPFVYDRVYGPFDSLDQFKQPGPTIKIFLLQGNAPAP